MPEEAPIYTVIWTPWRCERCGEVLGHTNGDGKVEFADGVVAVRCNGSGFYVMCPDCGEMQLWAREA